MSQQEKNLSLDPSIRLMEIVDLFEESEFSYLFVDEECKERNEKILYSLIEDMTDFVGSNLTMPEIVELLKEKGHIYLEKTEAYFIYFSYLHIVDVEKVVNREDNVCNLQDNASWKDHMNKALAEEIAKKQTYTALGVEDYYSPVNYEFFKSRGIYGEDTPKLIAAFNIKEDSWREFQGTDCFENDEEIGVSADLIFDNNTHYHARVEESFAALINKITTE